jgi:acetyl esterase
MDYTLDPELAAVATVIPKMDLADLASAREAERLVIEHLPKYEAAIPLSVNDITVPSEQGAAGVPTRIYAPADRSAAMPALLYLHGGAYVIGGLPIVDSAARLLVERAGVIVVAVDYRLAPEHPYPAALEDCYAVLQWAVGDGKEYGIDPQRLGVLGESAGGGLAAALALLTRDRGGPGLAAQFLDAPTIDDRLDTPSMKDLPDTPTWQAVNSPISWGYYLQGTAEPGGTDVPTYAAPARAGVEALSGLPPAYVAAYQVDPGRDEGLDYARRLMQAGVSTDIHHYADAFHVAHIIPGTAIGARMIDDRVEAVRRMLHVSTP